jgi:uncharacterized protein YprB with RNaseH-like and TPR domain
MKLSNILLFDIETTNLNANYGFILAACYKKIGDKKVSVLRIDDYKLHKRDCTNDYMLVRDLVDVLSSADMLVGHYSTRFDLPFVNSRALYHKLDLVAPVPHVDTWRVARNGLKLNSNRLASIAEFLGNKQKTPILNTQWLRAMAGHQKSIDYVVQHCIADIEVLEETYMTIRPLAKDHPNVNIMGGKSPDGIVCPVCGVAGKMQRRGYRTARVARSQRFHCTSCGAWSSGPPERMKGVVAK